LFVEVWFNDKYRTPPFGAGYRPHFVVKGTEEYLGIQFTELEQTPVGEHMLAEIRFLFHGFVDYSKLVTGVEFEIREGPNIVGEGMVL